MEPKVFLPKLIPMNHCHKKIWGLSFTSKNLLGGYQARYKMLVISRLTFCIVGGYLLKITREIGNSGYCLNKQIDIT
jgi:hypothetical protein